MQISELQKQVDEWINRYGVRYFDVLTNTVLLMEEVGEASSLIARMYGEQSFKLKISEKKQNEKLEEELGDILFVLTCIANQTGINLDQAMMKNLAKKTERDHSRHHKNPKLGH